MLTLEEKVDLVSSSLCSLGKKYKNEEFLKNAYNATRGRVLDEDLFFSDSASDVYDTMRALDTVTADYIKLLENEVSDLKSLVAGFGVGSVQHDAEAMRDLINSNK